MIDVDKLTPEEINQLKYQIERYEEEINGVNEYIVRIKIKMNPAALRYGEAMLYESMLSNTEGFADVLNDVLSEAFHAKFATKPYETFEVISVDKSTSPAKL